MQKLLYILFCITLISCNSKTEEVKEEEIVVFSDNGTTIYESDIYEVINGIYNSYVSEIREYKKDEKFYLIYYPTQVAFEVDMGLDEKAIKDYLILLSERELFKKEDVEFMYQQTQKSKEINLDQEKINNFQLIHPDTINKISSISKNSNDFGWKIHDKYGFSEIKITCLPIFSCDKKRVIFLSGSLIVGGGFLSVYEKTNGKWIHLKTIDAWM